MAKSLQVSLIVILLVILLFIFLVVSTREAEKNLDLGFGWIIIGAYETDPYKLNACSLIITYPLGWPLAFYYDRCDFYDKSKGPYGFNIIGFVIDILPYLGICYLVTKSFKKERGR